MTKSVARNEAEASELSAVRQENMETTYRVDVLERKMGDLQKQVTSMQDQMNRVETLLQGLVTSQTRAPERRAMPEVAPSGEGEMEMTRRMEDLGHININITQGIQLRGTPDGNYTHPSTGFSAVATGWRLDQVPHSSFSSPTLNHLNPNQEPALAQRWHPNPREYMSHPHYQYEARQWNPNPSTDRVQSFYKSIAKGPKLDFPRFDGSEPLEWIRQSETYFAMANVPEEAKLDLAQMYMVGRADRWLRSTGLLWNPPPWSEFCAMICDRFAQHSGYEVLENFHSVKQYSMSVSDYIDRFEELMAVYKSENPLQNPHFFVKCFVNGLRNDIKHYLKPLKPQNLCEAYWMAKDMEKGAGAVAKKDAQNAIVGQNKNLFPAVGIKPLNEANVQKKETLPKPFTPGVCRYCGDKWFLGHKCKQYQQVNLMASEVNEADLAEEEDQGGGHEETTEKPPSHSETKGQLMHISLQAVSGLVGVSTYTLLVKIGGKQGVALVDSGSSHTFIDLKFATQTTCKIQLTSLQKVTVAGGGTLLTGSYIAQADYHIGEEKFSNSFKVLPLKGFDIVLGCDWMYQHSPVSLDLKIRRLTIKKNGVVETVLEEQQSTPLVKVINPKSWDKAYSLIRERLDRWISPEVVTYDSIIDGMYKVQAMDKDEMFLNRMSKDGVMEDCTTYTILVHGYSSSGSCAEARKIFDSMVEKGPKPNVTTYGILFHGYAYATEGALVDMHALLDLIAQNDALCRVGRVDDAMFQFNLKIDEGLTPDIIVFSTLVNGLCTCDKWEKVEELAFEMTNRGIHSNAVFFNIMMGNLCKGGRLMEARNIFDLMVRVSVMYDVVSYSTMIYGYCLGGKMAEAMKLLDGMFLSGLKSNAFTYSTLLEGYCKDGRTEGASALFKEMLGKGIHPGAITYSIMLEGLFKSGRTAAAKKLIKSLKVVYKLQLLEGVRILPVFHDSRLQPKAISSSDFSLVSKDSKRKAEPISVLENSVVNFVEKSAI